MKLNLRGLARHPNPNSLSTDSIVIDNPLNPELVGDKLGQLKLEYEIARSVFLAPKVYGVVTMDDNFIFKCKGVSSKAISDVTIEELEAVLLKDYSHVLRTMINLNLLTGLLSSVKASGSIPQFTLSWGTNNNNQLECWEQLRAVPPRP